MAALSLDGDTKVVTLTSLSTIIANRVAIATLTSKAVCGVCFRRSIAIMATMAAMTHRTAIASAGRVGRVTTIANMIYLAAMTTLITIVWTTMVVMDDDGCLTSIATVAITWSLERHGLTNSSNQSQYVKSRLVHHYLSSCT